MVSRGAVSKNHDGVSTDQCIAHGNFGMMSKYDVNCSSSSSSVEKEEDGFVMPSRRDIDFTAPDFDPDAFLDLVAADVGLIQRQKLHDILSRNANVEYLQRHGLNGRTDVASFKQCVPVINYQDVETDILRLVNGDTSAPILTAEPVIEFQLRCVCDCLPVKTHSFPVHFLACFSPSPSSSQEFRFCRWITPVILFRIRQKKPNLHSVPTKATPPPPKKHLQVLACVVPGCSTN